MGWGRMILLGDLGQQMDIENTRREVEELRSQLSRQQGKVTRNLGDHIVALRQEVNETRLYVAALIRMLIGAGVVTKDEFAKIVEAVDASDGQADDGFTGRLNG